ncbi:hypothetical protein HDE_02080 [Halotydeus destructor]|nr:hypothetical protein HDE_02080 [Halotydeus destructor]
MLNYCKVFSCLSGLKKAQKSAERAWRKTKTVRIVALEVSQVVYNSENPYSCQLDGPLGSQFRLLPKLLGFNCTALAQGPSYLEGDGNYTGFIGDLQRSKADFSAMPKSMPLAGDPCAYSPVVTADKLSYVTMYRRPHSPNSDSDLLSSFHQIDSYSWLALAAMLISVYLVLKALRQQLVMFRIIECFFQHVGLQGSSLANKLLGSTMVITFYILALFYSNFLLTEIVRQEHANALKMFLDILRPSADIFFYEDYPVYDTLKTSKNPNLLKIAEKAGSEATLKGGIESYNKFLSLPDKLFGIFGGYSRLKAHRMLICATMQKAGINEDLDREKYSLWIPKDSPHEYFISLGYSKNLDPDIKQVLDSAIQHQSEHNLYGEIFHNWITKSILATNLLNDITPGHLCYLDEVLFEDPDNNHAISLHNTAWLFTSLVIGTLLATAVLIKGLTRQMNCFQSKRKLRRRSGMRSHFTLQKMIQERFYQLK